MSSISPIASRELNALLKEKGVEMLDAPVSGGQEKAEQGTLAIMVGGDSSAFEQARPILEKMGATVTLVGESGAGQITKLVNQMIVGINISAVAEGMAFAKKPESILARYSRPCAKDSPAANVLKTKRRGCSMAVTIRASASIFISKIYGTFWRPAAL